MTVVYEPAQPMFVSLPPELLAHLPGDPEAQLELAHRLVLHAHTQKVATLEADASLTRQTLEQTRGQVAVVQSRLQDAQGEISALREKVKLLDGDRLRLEAEKTALISTVKRLNADVAQLQGFKKTLLSSLNSSEQLHVDGHAPCSTSVELQGDRLVQGALGRSAVPQRPPALWVPGTSHNSSYSHFAASPALGSLGGGAYTPCSTAQPGAVPPSPHVDGKEFFRSCRVRMDDASFSTFVEAIKQLNAGQLGRQDTLRRAAELFGPANADLLGAFEKLLNRHLVSVC